MTDRPTDAAPVLADDALPFAKHPLTPEFWDDAHRRGSSSLLGDTEPEQYARLFNQIGPWDADMAGARDVLEVGPGKARWLQSLDGLDGRGSMLGVTRWAVDISLVNRTRLNELAINARPPDEPWRSGKHVDLAVALSVFQHCDDAHVEQLLEIVACALRPATEQGAGRSTPGGTFYCNGVAVMHGFQLAPGCISIHRPLDAMIRMALRAGLRVTGVLEQVPVGQGPITQWLLRLGRE